MMRFAFSNIGLKDPQDSAALDALRAAGFTGIEVAPTKLWPGWEGATPEAAAAHRTWLAARGFEVPSLQAVLFGRPDLKLFGEESAQRALVEHLTFVADLAAAFGAKAIVLGAPKNRDRGVLSPAAAIDVAVPLLREIGNAYAKRNTCLCIEPNPPQYACNFVTTAVEGRALVDAVASAGFGLHLDAAGLYLAGDDPEVELPRAAPTLRHFHVSEPNLGGFAAPVVDHARMLRLLVDGGYRYWTSVEVAADRHELGATCNYARALAAAIGNV
jgi:D-psicose/D-tagatose/L-ribulose 3-epimerase